MVLARGGGVGLGPRRVVASPSGSRCGDGEGGNGGSEPCRARVVVTKGLSCWEGDCKSNGLELSVYSILLSCCCFNETIAQGPTPVFGVGPLLIG